MRSVISATFLSAAGAVLRHSKRFQSSGDGGSWPFKNHGDGILDDLQSDIHEELAQVMAEQRDKESTGGSSRFGDIPSSPAVSLVTIEKLSRPPAKFDLLTNSFAFKWETTAAMGRKVTGPMKEWATEIKYRTGIHIEADVKDPGRLASGGYATADEVELTVYLFGTDRGVANCRKLMEAAVQQDPSYVRLAVFRRVPNQEEVEWLLLRRINRDVRPPDIPKISLKLPGKYTLFHETEKEAALRTLWEETGITVKAENVYPTGFLCNMDPNYFWRVPVRYFIAEVPYDVKVEGPQVSKQLYMQGWDARILRQSPDPIDRVWAQVADPETGCAWMKTAVIDELQKPRRGEDYMATRYTPPPHSNLQEVVGLVAPVATDAGNPVPPS